MIRRLLCRLFGHPPLAPSALWGSCRRCGQFHNARQGWKP